MSIFNNITLPKEIRKKNWSFLPPDKRNPEMKELLRSRTVAHIKPARKGVYVLNGEACDSFADVKVKAVQNGIEIIRMGAITVHI